MKFDKIALVFVCILIGSACSYTIKVKDGFTAYDRKYYAQAITMLEKEYNGTKNRVQRGKIAYLIGESNKHTGRYEQAIKWYDIAYANSFGPDALKAKAYMLKHTEQYTEAQDAFKKLGIEIGSQYEYRKELTACTVAQTWKKDADLTAWQISAAPFNSAANDFSPTIYSDGRLVFTSDRSNSTGKANYAWTNQRFMDLFIVSGDGASPQTFDMQLNTEANEGSICFSPNYQEAWFARSVGLQKGADHFTKIFYTQKTDGHWSAPEMLSFQKDQYNYMHPALAADGKTLYFATNDGAHGGYDLCFSVQTNQTWSEPKALGRAINTGGNELFPVWDKDTLYFASNEHTGMGGLDVFKTWKLDEKTWAPPTNLKAPINSGFDDYGFIVEKHYPTTASPQPGDLIMEGFFSSNRPDGKGGDDIYHFTQKIPIPKPAPPKVDTVIIADKPAKLFLDIFVVEKIHAMPDDPNSPVLGRKPIENARIELAMDGKPVSKETLASGNFSREVAANQNWTVKGMADGFLTETGSVSTAGFSLKGKEDQRVELELVLSRIYRNKEIVLENIYYDYDRAEIRLDAEPTLSKLAEMLNQNPGIKIQLGSHTDCRGNDRYNRDLSQRRAQSAVNYLIAKGISPERLSAVGYGESAPSATCDCQSCTETEHQTNRRTTFRVLE